MHKHAEVVVIDGCASRWVVNWPNTGRVADFVGNFWSYVRKFLTVSDLYMTFDRYTGTVAWSCNPATWRHVAVLYRTICGRLCAIAQSRPQSHQELLVQPRTTVSF